MNEDRRKAWDTIGDWWWWRQSEAEFTAWGERGIKAHITPFLDSLDFEPQGKRMLDLGCGQGRVTGPCGSLFSEVHGVDISPVMIGHAKDRWVQKSNVFFSANTGDKLEAFEDDYFDFCFSHVVFQHLPKMSIVDSYIREIGRVLKPGGLFRIQVETGQTSRFRILPRRLYTPVFNFLIEHDLIGWYSRMTMRDRRLSDALPGVVTTADYLHRIGAAAGLEVSITVECDRDQPEAEQPGVLTWFSGRKAL